MARPPRRPLFSRPVRVAADVTAVSERPATIPLKEGAASFFRGLLGGPPALTELAAGLTEAARETAPVAPPNMAPTMFLLGLAAPAARGIHEEVKALHDRATGVDPDTLSSQGKTLYELGLVGNLGLSLAPSIVRAANRLPKGLPATRRPPTQRELNQAGVQRMLDDLFAPERRPPTPPLNAAEERDYMKLLDEPFESEQIPLNPLDPNPFVPETPQFDDLMDQLIERSLGGPRRGNVPGSSAFSGLTVEGSNMSELLHNLTQGRGRPFGFMNNPKLPSKPPRLTPDEAFLEFHGPGEAAGTVTDDFLSYLGIDRSQFEALARKHGPIGTTGTTEQGSSHFDWDIMSNAGRSSKEARAAFRKSLAAMRSYNLGQYLKGLGK